MNAPPDTPTFPPEAASAFGLRPPIASRFLPEGLMNRNWRLDTAEGAFALKELRDIDPMRARRNLAVLARIAATGLPIPVPIAGVGGAEDRVVEIDGRAFYLFPWIEGVRIPGLDLPLSRIEELGALLARLHACLNGPSTGLPRAELGQSAVRTALDAYDQLDRFEAVIADRPCRDAFDEKAVEFLRRRRLLIAAHGGSWPGHAVPVAPIGWVHGDFHSTNLLWNDGRVAGILDWDRIDVQPLGAEVVRAAVLHFKDDAGRLDLPRVAAFIAGYRGVVPISAHAIADALRRLWWHHLTSVWILRYHYDRADSSCDHLLEPRENLLYWWTQHRDGVESAFIGGGS
jgi:homoserine kinase type II